MAARLYIIVGGGREIQNRTGGGGSVLGARRREPAHPSDGSRAVGDDAQASYTFEYIRGKRMEENILAQRNGDADRRRICAGQYSGVK